MEPRKRCPNHVVANGAWYNNKVPTMYLYIFETHASCHTMMAFKYPSAHYSLSPLL